MNALVPTAISLLSAPAAFVTTKCATNEPPTRTRTKAFLTYQILDPEPRHDADGVDNSRQLVTFIGMELARPPAALSATRVQCGGGTYASEHNDDRDAFAWAYEPERERALVPRH